LSGQQVQAELLGEKIPEPPKFTPPEPKDGEEAPPPPPMPSFDVDFSRIMRDPLEAGKRVVRAIKRGDMYILTHAEFKPGFEQRANAILRAFPADEPYDGFAKVFGILVNNPAFDKQTQVPAYEG